MSSRRVAIRQAIVDRLINQTDAGERVYPSRVMPLGSELMPAILVYGREELSDRIVDQAPVRKRTFTVKIEVRTRDTDDVDCAVDSIADQIEELIDQDIYFSGLATSSDLKGTSLEVSSSGAEPYGSATLNYEVTYIA